MNKKLSICFVAIAWVVSGVAHAARLDVSRLTQSGEFSATFGVAFESGASRGGHSQTDWGAGRIRQTDLELDYTFAEDWTVLFSTSNDYADAEIGAKYKILKTFPLKLDVLADYGFAFTKYADSGRRIGANNVDMGFRVHGIAWRNLQWAFKPVAQYVWDEPFDFWNVNLTAELMYYVCNSTALNLKYEYDFVQIGKSGELQHSGATLGMVYNMSDTASLHPYLKYHFRTTNVRPHWRAYDDYWKMGIEFSVQF
ncbi:MAG: hypothetical protein NC311_03825 [Muribaculaceae bacterium]|nr:hypothetical protein [Muribaculaceae bacterium]